MGRSAIAPARVDRAEAKTSGMHLMIGQSDPIPEFESWADIAYSNMVQNESILRLLLKKGIITKEEFIDESKEVHEAFMAQQQELT